MVTNIWAIYSYGDECLLGIYDNELNARQAMLIFEVNFGPCILYGRELNKDYMPEREAD